jgi:hypothetical protein
MKVLIEWHKTIKDHEAILQLLGRDPAGNVSEGYLAEDSTGHLTMFFAGLHYAFLVL